MSNPAKKSSGLHYILAVVVLTGSAMAMQVFDFQIIKKPLPLRKSLIDFDRTALRPLERVDANILDKDVVAELGTDEYIEWTLKDWRIAAEDRQHVSLFLTYYTNVQDQVPHVPEECYHQSGSSAKGNDDTLSWSLTALPDEEIDVRRLGFVRLDRANEKTFVYYTIAVNGSFYAGRQGARLKMKSFEETHLYYSKIEIAFHGFTDDDIPQLDDRARELMDLTVAELFENHWPPRGTEIGGNEGLEKRRDAAESKPQ